MEVTGSVWSVVTAAEEELRSGRCDVEVVYGMGADAGGIFEGAVYVECERAVGALVVLIEPAPDGGGDGI